MHCSKTIEPHRQTLAFSILYANEEKNTAGKEPNSFTKEDVRRTRRQLHICKCSQRLLFPIRVPIIYAPSFSIALAPDYARKLHIRVLLLIHVSFSQVTEKNVLVNVLDGSEARGEM